MQLPVACLPAVLVPLGLIVVVCLGPVSLIPGFPSLGWILHSVPWACLPPSWVTVVGLAGYLCRTVGPAYGMAHWRVQCLGIYAVWLCFLVLLSVVRFWGFLSGARSVPAQSVLESTSVFVF